MGDVVPMPERRAVPTTVSENPGNGAREALIDVALCLPGTEASDHEAAMWSDWILMELWVRGYQVVPLAPDQDAAS